MNIPQFRTQIQIIAVLIMLMTAFQITAQPTRRGPYGDWNITTQFGEMQFDSILNFSRNDDGNPTGSWISFWGVTELKDLNFDNNQLSFTQTFRGRDGDMTSSFKGTIENGKLTGTTTSDRGESKVTGQRAPRISPAVGSWDMKMKAGEREFTGTLIVTSDGENNLSGTWKSERGESQISDLTYSRGELTFKRTMKFNENQWESQFNGTLRGNTITGMLKSDRFEAETTGERIGGELIGTWNLDLESDFGARKQRLRILPDMTALFGSIAVKEVQYENNQVQFKATQEFGDREFETEFTGKIDDNKITGELTTGQGSRKVTGIKQARRMPRTTQ